MRTSFARICGIALLFASGSTRAQIGEANADLRVLLGFVSELSNVSFDNPSRTTVAEWTADAIRELVPQEAARACERGTSDQPATGDRLVALVWRCSRAENPGLTVEAIARRVSTRIDAGSQYWARIADPAGRNQDTYRLAQDAPQVDGGIGVTLERLDSGALIVRSVFPGSPAERAGLRSGDTLTAVNGTAVRGASLDSVIRSLRGASGSHLELEWRSSDGAASRHFVDREVLTAPAAGLQINDGIAVLTIIALGQGAETNIRSAISATPVSSYRAMLVDVRYAGFGLLDTATGAADIFLPRGEVYTIVARGNRRRHQNVGNQIVPADRPLFILVGGRTTGTAEVLAAALKDRGRATILGEPTAGGTVVRDLIQIGPYGAVTVRSGTIQRPNGQPLDRGIEPDIPINLASRGSFAPATDWVLEEAIAIVRRRLGGENPTTPTR